MRKCIPMVANRLAIRFSTGQAGPNGGSTLPGRTNAVQLDEMRLSGRQAGETRFHLLI
jgi:hypothetical protein